MRRLMAEDYAVDAVTAAKALVGAWLCRRLDDGTVIRRRITETEAYCGEEDTACHAHKGRTARTDVMYSPGGCAYIYLCYGMHEMLNVVTGPEGRPEAVLIRALPDAQVPYSFCDEFICHCRADMPKPLLEKWGDKDNKPCPAGKSFGVVGPNGLYRTCLHSLPKNGV